jgi:hypothetical protein
MIEANHFVARIPCEANNASEDGFIEHHLLVYDSSELLAGEISQNVRDLLGRYPFTTEVSICCPNIDDDALFKLVASSSSLDRVTFQGAFFSAKLSTLCFNKGDASIGVNRVLNTKSEEPSLAPLKESVKDAWLFDLFHRHHCLVSAPDGIHFGKTSGKHSAQFIRAANAFVGSLECNLIAFFLLPFATKISTKRIYVDTGPLITVAMALRDQCLRRRFWGNSTGIESFSSYDGVDKLKNAPNDHIVLISASTSGGLESSVVDRTGQLNRITTLFYIQAIGQEKASGHCLCNLTETQENFTGYPEIETYTELQSCKWCMNGVPLAEFEGDQFLLQRRKVQKINLSYHPNDESKRSLKPSAISFFSQIKSRQIAAVRTTAQDSDGYRDVRFDSQKYIEHILSESDNAFKQTLKKSNASAFDFLISDMSESADFSKISNEMPEFTFSFKSEVKIEQLQHIHPVSSGKAMVILSLIASMLEPRKISELLRSRLPDGEVTYLTCATLIETPEQFRQLCVALKTGARGSDTFDFEPGHVLTLRKRFDPATTWERERSFLTRIIQKDQNSEISTEIEILGRLAILKASGEISENLFWNGQNGSSLRLQQDFVFMPVNSLESQADVYAIVSCMLSTAIQHNRDPITTASASDMRKSIRDSVYSEALIDPNNFLKYNDAILRASLLRAANSAELNYSSDLELSSSVTQLIMHEIDEWRLSRGQVLSEFLVALGIGHLKLCNQHIRQLSNKLKTSVYLPEYIQKLGKQLPI